MRIGAAKNLGYLEKAELWYLRLQNCQSSSGTLNMALVALWSQRPLRLARPRLMAGIALGLPNVGGFPAHVIEEALFVVFPGEGADCDVAAIGC